MVARASIVGAVETNVGKVRDHNEDSFFLDPDAGIFIVCDGMGGHAAGEVASALAVQTIRGRWSSREVEAIADRWLTKGTPEAHRQLIGILQEGVAAAHHAILAEAKQDRSKGGMGTTVVGAMVVGADIVFAHCGDSRAYLVRDGIAMQLTEDHTLAARLLAAGVDLDVDGDGARFKSMLTNALGIGQECKVSTFVVPLADGDRFLLCSDGITEYVKEAEVGQVLTQSPSPARAAQRLVELALERGGGDNATAMVVRVLEAGETARPAEAMRRDEEVLRGCPLLAKLSPQQRLRALRIALPRDHAAGERVPAVALGDRVAWIVVDGELEQGAALLDPGALLYPEALLPDRPLPDKHGLATVRRDVRALALRADDFGELCEDDPDLAEALLAALAAEMAVRAAAGAADGAAHGAAVVVGMPLSPDAAAEPVPEPIPDGMSGPTGRASSPASARTTIPLPAPLRPPAPADSGDVAYAATPPRGMPVSDADERPPTPPLGTPVVPGRRRPTPRLGTAIAPAARPPTPPLGTPLGRPPKPANAPLRPITPPLGVPLQRRPTPPLGAAPPRAPTPPKGALPKLPSLGAIPPIPHTKLGGPRSSSPGAPGLIVPPSARADAAAAIDHALSEISVDRGWAELESDDPPPLAPPPSARPATGPGDASEPEIVIERAADEVPRPAEDVPRPAEIAREGSGPEVLVIQPGRAITADDTPLVAGTIDRDDGEP